MIVALGLPLRSVANVELQRAFNCLLDNVQFFSPSTIKNRLMTRSQEIIPLLLERLPRGSSKVTLALDCWSSFNRQGYLAINAYFIDDKWNYHEVLLAFEHVEGSHTGIKLAEVLNSVLIRHSIEDRVLALTTDSASNNTTMVDELRRMIRSNRALALLHTDANEIQRVPCLSHVIQLAVKQLLGCIHINPKNADFKTSWDDKQDRRDFENPTPGVPLTLAKARFILW